MKLSYLDSSGNVTGLDRFGRIADQIWTDYGANPNVVFDEYTYTYDRAGNRTSRTNELNHDLDETYEYDALDRLVAWDLDGVEQKTWTLDSLGNNLSSGTYNAANEETPTQGSSGYDAAGNMTTLTNGDTAVYDAWNRMVEVNDGEDIIQQNEYDGTNRRIQIFTDFDGTTPDAVQDNYYNGQQVIESDATVDLMTMPARDGGYQYLWSPRYIDAPILRDTLNTAGTDIVQAERVLYLADANYNVTGLLKYDSQASDWTVAERYTYTPYGVVTYRNADWTTAGYSANSNSTLYTGRTLDLLTGLNFYRARFYDALLERFVNRDPIGGINLYRYCSNRPTSLFDPFGLYEMEWEGDWPDNLRQKILDSFGRISKRCDDLIKDIDKELASLSPCMRDQLAGDLNKLKKVLQGVKNGIASKSENLEIYHYDFGSGSDARGKAKPATGFWYDGWIAINDGMKPDWQTTTNDDLDSLVFHELTHLYGTEDDDSVGDLMNAHTIDNMIEPGRTVSGNTIYTFMKRKATEKCKQCPPEPGLQRPGFPDPFGFPWIF